MKINIAASHRFHLLDLARELAALGHDVRFYSYVPASRCEAYGLPRENCRSLVGVMLPWLALARVTKNAHWAVKIVHVMLDLYLSIFMERCDLFIGLGTVYERSFVAAKKRFGAKTILEWGSKHIDAQQAILSRLPGAKVNPEYFNRRSRQGYALADFIALPAEHAKQTFIEAGIPAEKILVNPYGVDLKMFYPTELDPDENYDLIAVGAWSQQKGSDLLVELCRSGKYSLLHVGSIVDVEFPDIPTMRHVDSVDQKELVNYYKKARVFVHPSRQDGLAMVQCQAIACGLPVVCSKNSGGKDLKFFLTEKKWLIEIEQLTVEFIEEKINKALNLSGKQLGLRSYAVNSANEFSWSSYGKRYEKNLINIKNN